MLMVNNLVKRLRVYAAPRKGELAELITEAANALEEKHARGTWETVKELDHDHGFKMVTCNLCRNGVHLNVDPSNKWNYCPFCGAKMDANRIGDPEEDDLK